MIQPERAYLLLPFLLEVDKDDSDRRKERRARQGQL